MNCSKCKNRYKYVSVADCKEFSCTNFKPKEPKPLYEVGQTVMWSGKDVKGSSKLLSEPMRICIRDCKPLYICGDLDHYHYIPKENNFIIDEDQLSLLPSEPKSAHNAGEKFNEDWEYASELRLPKKVRFT